MKLKRLNSHQKIIPQKKGKNVFEWNWRESEEMNDFLFSQMWVYFFHFLWVFCVLYNIILSFCVLYNIYFSNNTIFFYFFENSKKSFFGKKDEKKTNWITQIYNNIFLILKLKNKTKKFKKQIKQKLKKWKVIKKELINLCQKIFQLY